MLDGNLLQEEENAAEQRSFWERTRKIGTHVVSSEAEISCFVL
jgi:hypothetical protein